MCRSVFISNIVMNNGVAIFYGSEGVAWNFMCTLCHAIWCRLHWSLLLPGWSRIQHADQLKLMISWNWKKSNVKKILHPSYMKNVLLPLKEISRIQPFLHFYSISPVGSISSRWQNIFSFSHWQKSQASIWECIVFIQRIPHNIFHDCRFKNGCQIFNRKSD